MQQRERVYKVARDPGRGKGPSSSEIAASQQDTHRRLEPKKWERRKKSRSKKGGKKNRYLFFFFRERYLVLLLLLSGCCCTAKKGGWILQPQPRTSSAGWWGVSCTFISIFSSPKPPALFYIYCTFSIAEQTFLPLFWFEKKDYSDCIFVEMFQSFSKSIDPKSLDWGRSRTANSDG